VALTTELGVAGGEDDCRSFDYRIEVRILGGRGRLTTQGANLLRFAPSDPEPWDDLVPALDAHVLYERLQQRLASRDGTVGQCIVDVGTQRRQFGVGGNLGRRLVHCGHQLLAP
jgi:hypothetical protein